jgi:hypothetical protein
MASHVIRGLGVVVAAGVFALTAAPPAEALTFGPCTITALTPTPVAIDRTGRKVAAGRASIRCSPSRPVQLDIALYGEDPLLDDSQDHDYPRGIFGPELQTLSGMKMCSNPPDPTQYICSDQGDCDEDIGADELYSRVRARFYVDRRPGAVPPDLVFTAWSAWTRGPTVTYTC